MATERRQYDKEFKLHAVRLSLEKGKSVASVSKDLGIAENNLWRWREQYAKSGEKAFPGTGHLEPDTAELVRLRRELKKVTEERDILKKALAFFSRDQE
jgi:transposase